MKKKMTIFLILLVMLSPVQVLAVSVSARSACLLDTESGRVIYQKDKDTPRLIASITNIMTT